MTQLIRRTPAARKAACLILSAWLASWTPVSWAQFSPGGTSAPSTTFPPPATFPAPSFTPSPSISPLSSPSGTSTSPSGIEPAASAPASASPASGSDASSAASPSLVSPLPSTVDQVINGVSPENEGGLLPLNTPELKPLTQMALPTLGPAQPIPLRAVLEKKRTLELSLQDAFRLAEGKNLSLKIAQETQKIQQNDFWLRLSDLLPDITMQYTQSKLTGAVQVFGGGTTEVERITYQPQITGNYIVYTGGRNIFEIQASKHRLEALKKQTEATRQDILQQVALAFYDMQAAYWQRSLSLQALRESEQQVELTRARFQGGIGLQVDQLQAESTLSLRQQELVAAERLISIASENLAQLLNLDFDVDILPNTLDAEIMQRVPETLSTQELLKIAHTRNPNLERLTELARAGKSDLNVSIASLFPQINLSAYRNKTGDSPSTWLPTTFYGLQASWNLFENSGFARPLAIRQAKSNLAIARYNREQGERILQQNIANSWIGLSALKQTIDAARNNVRYSQLAHEQAVGRLREGVGTNIDLQLALTNLAKARSDLAAAFLNYNRLQVNLLYNLGVLSPVTMAQGFKP